MRQLLIQVPEGEGETVVEEAESLEAVGTARFHARSADGEGLDVIFVHLSNRSVSPFLEALEPIPELRVAFFPYGVLTLRPPTGEVPEQVEDVEERSPIEVFLAGVQSIGSWKGFLGYAAATGFIAWIGLFTNTVYLLTAAMLIAPFAGPAMNTALAAVSGDMRLLRSSLLRYGSSIVVAVVVSFLLSLLFGLASTTSQMISQSEVSAAAVLLPLVAGAAGALHLVQSERDSLVSGAAIGVLVAASLAPPAALLGMAAALSRWNLMLGGVFVLLLQLAGITFSSMIVFKMYGVRGKGTRYEAENRYLFPVGLAVSGLVLAALLTWQFAGPVELERSSLTRKIETEVGRIVDRQSAVTSVQVNSRFPRPEGEGNVVVTSIYLRQDSVGAEPEHLHSMVVDSVLAGFDRRWPTLDPLVEVHLLQGPAATSR